MRYTVVMQEQKADGEDVNAKVHYSIETLAFENKRDLNKWIDDVGLDVNRYPARAGKCIHVDANGKECLIFKGDPEALRIERTVGV